MYHFPFHLRYSFVFTSLSGAVHIQFQSVEQIMFDDKMRELFSVLVEKSLCGESLWFLQEVSG